MILLRNFLNILPAILIMTALVHSCKPAAVKQQTSAVLPDNLPINKVSLIILGTAQDGGSPHPGCSKACCKTLFEQENRTGKVVSIGIIDPENKKKILIEATPDLPFQIKRLSAHCPFESKETPDAIFITHAHIGHYTGLMYLGKEALNTNKVPVYVMPRFKNFLENNGPWSQLASIGNIALTALDNGQPVQITPGIKITPFTVPHRDEFSETVGYEIEGPSQKALFIPDIDKWEKWETGIINAIASVDYAFIDGTFYDGEEINNRDISEIPHPFIIESMALFSNLPAKEKNKIYFIHFNHTNPALNLKSKQTQTILENGFHIASENQIVTLQHVIYLGGG